MNPQRKANVNTRTPDQLPDLIEEKGRANQGIPDSEVLDFVHEKGRAVLTHNRKDFIRLHRLQPAHSGIIVCTRDGDFGALAERIHNQLCELSSFAGQLVRVNRFG